MRCLCAAAREAAAQRQPAAAGGPGHLRLHREACHQEHRDTTSYEPPHPIRRRPVVPLHAPMTAWPTLASLTRKESVDRAARRAVIRSRSATGASQRQCASIRLYVEVAGRHRQRSRPDQVVVPMASAAPVRFLSLASAARSSVYGGGVPVSSAQYGEEAVLDRGLAAAGSVWLLCRRQK